MTDIHRDLMRPFDPNRIHWRVGATTRDNTKGIALAYIDARDVMKRLDDVIGAFKWEDYYRETPSGRVICSLTLTFNDGTSCCKSDGAGGTQVEGDKGAISDAFKRAAVKFGIGRYLYYLPNVWVPLNERKQIITPPDLPKWATPEGFDK